jgi:hypothetical protein
MKIQELLKVAETGSLTKKERAQAREQIGAYYAKKLSGLQENLFAVLEKRHTGALDPFEIDAYIHRYHKQSQELYIYMNHRSLSNDNLPRWLRDMDDDERGMRVWQPETELQDEEAQS